MRIAAFALFALLTATEAAAALTPGTAVPVRILYDNSGSMYAGYQPPGAADRRSRAELGASFFHQSPQFRAWLQSFVQRQSIVDAGTVGMWTFTSGQRFLPSDIHEVHPSVALERFDVARAIRNFPASTGDNTYLTETVEAFTRDFTGILWLITDNIAESQDGQTDAGVRRFFETLSAKRELRSVHLFKYPVEENGRRAALAVYGFVVSAAEVPVPTLAHYDGKFRTLGEAKQNGGADLFPGRSHLKLKDLEIDAVRPDLRLFVEGGEDGKFREGQNVRLKVEGDIRSYLTQHTVIGGRYELAIVSPFVAEEQAQRNLGARPLAPEIFNAVGGGIDQPIPPGGSHAVEAQFESTQPVTFQPRSLVEWLRLAWNGADIRYTATARMSFSDVQVRLEPQRMTGIFGMDRAATVFRLQDVTTLPGVQPSDLPVTFVLRAGSSRTGILLAALAVLVVLLAAAAFLLSRTQIFRIAISGTPERITALRRLGRHDVILEGKLLGRLSRGFLNSYGFDPIRGDAMLTVVAASDPDTWEVRLAGATTRRLSIKAEGGRPSRPRKASAPASRSTPPPPPPLPSSKSVPPRPPRIGRT